MLPQMCYWNNNGKHQHVVGALQAKIPAEGPVDRPYKNKALERFRKASNNYYRLYNDGDFNTGKGKMFGVDNISRFKFYRWSERGRCSYPDWADGLYAEVELGMDKIIEAACAEQGIALI